MEAIFKVANAKDNSVVLTYRVKELTTVDGWEVYNEGNYWLRFDKLPASISGLSKDETFTIPDSVHKLAHKMSDQVK